MHLALLLSFFIGLLAVFVLVAAYFRFVVVVAGPCQTINIKRDRDTLYVYLLEEIIKGLAESANIRHLLLVVRREGFLFFVCLWIIIILAPGEILHQTGKLYSKAAAL